MTDPTTTPGNPAHPDTTAPVCREPQGCHRVIECDPGCGATSPAPAPVDEAPSPTWATLVEAIAALPPAPGPYPDTRLRGRVAATILARIKLAVVKAEPLPSGQIGSILAPNEYDLADVALAELAPELDLLAEVTQARQHGAYTYCTQQVGHVTIEAFARKINEKRTALAQREEAVRYANEQRARAEEATTALAEVLAAVRTFGATGAHTTPGEHIHVSGRITDEQYQRWQRIAHGQEA